MYFCFIARSLAFSLDMNTSGVMAHIMCKKTTPNALCSKAPSLSLHEDTGNCAGTVVQNAVHVSVNLLSKIWTCVFVT